MAWLWQKKISIDISGMSDSFGNNGLGGIDICGTGHIFASTLGEMTFDMCNAEMPKLDICSQGIDLCGNDQMHIQSDFIEISGNESVAMITNNSIKLKNSGADHYIDISSGGIDISWNGRIVVQM